MADEVRVIEYSFGDPEQRRGLAEAMAEEIRKGATVAAAVPVSLRPGAEGDLDVTRIAVYYLGGDDAPPETAAEAVATATASDEAPAVSLVEDIMSIPPPEPE